MCESITHGLLHLTGSTLKLKMQHEACCTCVLPQLHYGQGIEIRAEVEGPRIKHLPLAKLFVENNRLIGTAVQRRVSDRARVRFQKDICEFHRNHIP